MPENVSQNDSDRGFEDEVHTPRGISWVIGQGILIVLFLISVFAGDPVEDVPGLLFARAVGLLVAVAGAAVSTWAGLQHGTRLTPFPRPIDDMPLIDRGPYRYVRHPIYSGIIIFTLGVGLAYANPVTLLSSVTFLVFFMAKTGYEEDLLVEHIPGYRQYRSAVAWRLFPFLV